MPAKEIKTRPTLAIGKTVIRYVEAPAFAHLIRRVTPEEWLTLCDDHNPAVNAVRSHHANVNHFLTTGHKVGECETVKKPYKPAKPKKDIYRADAPWSGVQKHSRTVELMPESQRFAPQATYFRCVELAHHHTTRARSKKERTLDHRTGPEGFHFPAGLNKEQMAEFWFERGPRRTKIYPVALSRLKHLKGQKRKRYCRLCNAPFECKRIDAEYCSPKCRKAAYRAGKR
jgi:hypothetical protein